MNKGFTLVEVLVGITVFVLVISISIGFFVHVIQSQRKVLAYQELFDQTSFIMEYMTRGIRMAKRQRTATEPINPQCVPVGRNYELVGGSPSHLRFIRWDRTLTPPSFVCYEFFLEGATLRVRRGGVTTSLTSPRLEVVNLRFRIEGDGVEATRETQLQPRITIILEVRGREYDVNRRSSIHFQTTVSQRDLDH